MAFYVIFNLMRHFRGKWPDTFLFEAEDSSPLPLDAHRLIDFLNISKVSITWPFILPTNVIGIAICMSHIPIKCMAIVGITIKLAANYITTIFCHIPLDATELALFDTIFVMTK